MSNEEQAAEQQSLKKIWEAIGTLWILNAFAIFFVKGLFLGAGFVKGVMYGGIAIFIGPFAWLLSL